MDFGRRRKVDSAFNMSSMTDLVFLLLIFFIILSTMIAPPAVKVNLPSGNVENEHELPLVSLSIDKELNHYINKDLVPVELIEEKLDDILAQFEGSEKQPSITLNVDKEVPTGVTTNILVIARNNQWKLAIATDGK